MMGPMRGEIRPLLTLAAPVILAEIGWMAMGIVDTIMVGPLGPAAIAAAGMGSSVFTAIVIFGMGLMLGLDTFVSQAYGARRLDECLEWLHHGIWLALIVGPLLMAATWLVALTLDAWGLHPEIRVLVGPYIRNVSFGALPLLLYAAFRRYLQGIHVVKPVMFALITANLVNAAVNWVLIYGHLGFPAMGVQGSAWATNLARVYMAVFLYVALRLVHHRRGDAHPHVPMHLSLTRMRRLIGLGLPAASQIALEVGGFAAATALAGKLDPVSSGGHQIAMNVAGLAFMVPLGLSSASAVRVGHALGAGDPARARRAGWTALAVGCVLMVSIGLSLLTFREWLVRVFTGDLRLIAVGVQLLAVAAAFQLFDGVQAVATGVLRGSGDTRTPVLFNIVGYWVLGLPVGYALCFNYGWGVIGLWFGLSAGLIIVALALTLVWIRRGQAISAGE
jgi:multidrug resistance protein, MATE family